MDTYVTQGVSTRTSSSTVLRDTEAGAVLHYIVPLGRVLFSLIFIMSGLGHFGRGMVGYAASQGVPAPGLLVPLSGLIAIVGGLSILLGYQTRLGALLLVLFLVPVTFMMHHFWDIPDAMVAMNQQAHFFKNIALLGGTLFIAYFGGGPLSMDERLNNRVDRIRY